MAELSVYTFEDADGTEFGSFRTVDYNEALEYGRKNSLRVIENVYEWTEQLTVNDFTDEPVVDQSVT